MSKPFTYWFRLAMVATMCTLVTFSPVSAGRWMDRFLHRDSCKVPAADNCALVSQCEPTCVPAASPCYTEPQTSCGMEVHLPANAGCDSMPSEPCGCEVGEVASPLAMQSAPIVHTPAPVVQTPAPIIQTPAPVVQKPAPVAQTPAPVVQKPAPVVQKPAPVVQTPAPVVQTPAPVVQTPAPVVQTPAPKIEIPEPVIQIPAPSEIKPVPTEKLLPEIQNDTPDLTAPNPFDAPSTKKSVEVAPETNVDDLFKDATPIKPEPIEPAMPAKPPTKSDIDDIFGDEPSKPAPVESVPEIQNPSIDNLFDPPESKPVVPEEDSTPKEKPADSNIEDLFKPEASRAAHSSINELIGKPIAAELDTSKELPKTLPTENESFLDNLFGFDSSKPSQRKADVDQTIEESLFLPAATVPTVIEPTLIEPTVIEPAVIEPAVIEPTVIEPAVIEPAVIEPAVIEPAVIEPAVIEPAVIEEPLIPSAKEKEPAKVKESVDDLDALFGVGAHTPSSEFKGAEFRQWIDNSGTYRVKARLVVIYVDRIKLLKENGKISTVPLSRLSDADFGYVSWVASNLTNEQASRMVKSEKDSDLDR